MNSCNQSSFGGSAGSMAREQTPTPSDDDKRRGDEPGAENGLGKEQGAPPNADAADAGRPEEARCLSKPVDVRVIFLLDATASMQFSIDLVKGNVQAFSQAVQNIKFSSGALEVASVEIGVITYRDDVSELRQIPFGPVDQLGAALGWIAAGGGQDAYEGGLTALVAGLEMIADKSQSPDHDLLPVVVAVTDNFSHNGVGGFPPGQPEDLRFYQQRNCQVDWEPLAKKLGRKAFDRLLVYDASPTFFPPELSGGVGPCGGYETPGDAPDKQWRDLRALWGTVGKNRPTTALGRGFGFPFTADGLLTTLPQDLAASFKACPAKTSAADPAVP
jgi:hypothetical protein